MSIKREWRRLEKRVKAWWEEFKRTHLVADDPRETVDGRPVEGTPAPQSETDGAVEALALPNPSLASCWEGNNAEVRHMNELSAGFSDGQVSERLDWAVKRGCNTVHWFLVNKGDGEKAGYSIYGSKPTLGKLDESAVERMARRCRMAIRKGLSVVLWLLADDSDDWVKTVLGNPGQFAADLAASGLLRYASCVVLGLEMNETKGGNWSGLAAAVRKVWEGPIGVHHTNDVGTYAKLGDLVFWQVDKGTSAAEVEKAVQNAMKSTGKPVFMFELARNPQRGLCERALAKGAVGVGNW